MNDRFKFRVWDKINEKWINNNCLLDIESGYLFGWYDNEQANKRRYKLMQSTGIKDKNGKLVYESDIITDEIDNYVVEWDTDEAYLGFWVREIGTREYYTFEQLLSYEVIGNIYENKDLLNEDGRN